jgi:hypothetical protein
MGQPESRQGVMLAAAILAVMNKATHPLAEDEKF